MIAEPKFLTTQEVADLWRIHPNSVRRMVRRDGELRPIRIGNKLRFPVEGIQRFEKEHQIIPWRRR